jgi:ribosomal protein L12E/L44/L45/RPP1/RPP2
MDKPTVEQSEEKLKVLHFFIAVLKDEALLDKLVAALDGKDYDVMLDLAQKNGYSFSKSALVRGLKRIANVLAPIALLEE